MYKYNAFDIQMFCYRYTQCVLLFLTNNRKKLITIIINIPNKQSVYPKYYQVVHNLDTVNNKNSLAIR